ncbi:class I SAM-dependent methyltransferase [Kibdelosporangium lantanae]|uniref:Class I SAM-dependent methyltransferase n=1 Tax=Kibdelosporangium lantanae TaxID=1497396 RepID=A0ABW3M3F9_9PSEU
MDEEWIDRLLSHADMAPNRTGHAVIPAGPPEWGGRHSALDVTDRLRHDLGLGWLYYAFVRSLRPSTVVCIGSGRGFVPVLLAKALADLHADHPIMFVDPSFDDDFWRDAAAVRRWFATFDVDKHIQHHLMTTEQFTATQEFAELPLIDFLFIDGGHFYETVRTDYDLLTPKLAAGATVMMHDTVSRSANPKWSGPRQLLLEVAQTDPDWQLLDLPFGAGVTILRRQPMQCTQEYFDGLCADWPHPGSLDF